MTSFTYLMIYFQVRAAAGMADKMKPFLDEVDPQALKSPIMNYELYKKDKIDAFIENQKNRQLISSVNQLFVQEDYAVVKDVLLANLATASNGNGQPPPLTEARVHHLLMMIESLWHLDDFDATMAWTEQSIDELMRCSDPEIAQPADLFNLLKTFECCVVMKDRDLSGLEERPRLASNLLKLVLIQVEGLFVCLFIIVYRSRQYYES